MNAQFLSVAVLLATAPAPALPPVATGAPQVGDKAPVFEALDQDGRSWKMADFLGKKVILLYFYPKDDTPGCAKQACGWRDQREALKKKGVEIVGVSFDSAASHRKFIDKHRLNFTLLADPEGKIADLYGARREPGKNIARRVSFLIGRDGRVFHVTDQPSADAHLNECATALSKAKQE